jgi:hypothetical protein
MQSNTDNTITDSSAEDQAANNGRAPQSRGILPDQQHPSRRRRRRSNMYRFTRLLQKTLKWQYILAALLTVTIIPAAIVFALVADSNARVDESLSSLRRVVSTIADRPLSQVTLADVNRLKFGVDAFTQALTRAEQSLNLVKPFLSLNPGINARAQLLPIAKNVSLAANEMITGIQPSLTLMLSNEQGGTAQIQISSSERLVEQLKIGQGNFIRAEAYLRSANADLQALSTTSMPPDVLLTVQELTRYLQQAIDFNKILTNSADLLSAVLGLDQPADYLILSQNSDELRPSGGYISTWGWMRVRRAAIVDYGYSPTSPTSPNPPPEELGNELAIPSWWIQYKHPVYMAFDGSWYADFPSTAKMAAWFYDKGDNPRSPVSGVIGIDIAGFEYLLAGLDKVKVADYDGVEVTSQNFREVIYKYRLEGGNDIPHKRFLSALYKQILNDWLNASKEKTEALIGGLVRALQEKHIMLYFTDERLNNALHLLGWDGAQNSDGTHDYLMVADANLGNKSNRSIVRQITYDVDIQPDGSLKSRASIAYDYSAQLAAKDPGVQKGNYNDINYFNIMQVYVPPKAVLGETKNLQSDVNTVDGDKMTTFATLTEVKFDSSQRYQFSYTTPVVVQQVGSYYRYRLLLQKQAGMLGEFVDVQVTLPPNARMVASAPAPTTSFNLSQAILAFHVQLTTDQWVEIVYSK